MSDQGYIYKTIKGLTDNERTEILTEICMILNREGEDKAEAEADIREYVSEFVYKNK